MHLKNRQYQTLMRHYDRLQLEHRRDQEAHIREVHSRIPAFADLDARLAVLAADYARASVAAPADSRQTLRLEYEEAARRLDRERAALLTQAGYPEDYTQLQYTCPDCRDTGYLADGSPCHCFRKAIVDLIYDQSGVQERLQYENFDHFDLSRFSSRVDPHFGGSPRQFMEIALDMAQSFVTQFDQGPRHLLIYGGTGTGKTFLTSCIAKALMDRSKTVIYLSAFALMEAMRAAVFGDADDETVPDGGTADYILDCDLLVIDDLGSELDNTFTNTQLFNCLNERLLARRATIITTNLSLKRLQDRYSERIFSRITSEFDVLELIGEDLRR